MLRLLAGVTAALMAALSAALPPPLVLPALSLVAVGAAAVAAVLASCIGARRESPRLTAWDVAGALALVGVAAGMLSEPAQVLQLFGLATSTR